MSALIFYTTGPRCMQCVMTHRMLEQLGLDYDLRDLTDPANTDALEYVTDDLGYTQAPILVVTDEPENHWSGFDPDRLKALAARRTSATRWAAAPGPALTVAAAPSLNMRR